MVVFKAQRLCGGGAGWGGLTLYTLIHQDLQSATRGLSPCVKVKGHLCKENLQAGLLCCVNWAEASAAQGFFYTFYFFKIIKIEIKSKLPDFSIYFF